MKQSIWKYNSIDTLRKLLQNDKVVLSGGCFDLIHYGHYSFLKNAREAGDKLVIALESDEYIKTRKGRTPVHTQQERAEILSSLEMVDHVLLLPFFSSDSEYGEMAKRISPKVVAITKGDPHLDKKSELAGKIGASVVEVVRLMPGFSTSKVIDMLQD